MIFRVVVVLWKFLLLSQALTLTASASSSSASASSSVAFAFVSPDAPSAGCFAPRRQKQQQQQHHQRLHYHHQHFSQLKSTTTTTTTSTSNSNSPQQQEHHFSEESDRLSKARLLLQQITNDENDDTAPGRWPTSTNKGFASTTKKNGMSSSSTTSTSTSSSTSFETTTVVPDAYWVNDHLMANTGTTSSKNSSLFVTRWARGVKVAEPLVKYDPVAAEKLLFRQPYKWILRNFQIAVPFGYWAALVVSDYVLGTSKQNRRKRAQQLTRAISSLGPAIIKGGQALASRPDLLPSEYLEELQTLQDDVPRFSNQRALQTVEEELDIKFEDVFELLQEEPVAAASIGQVYKARLIANSDTVALKIQRPSCEEVIALDLYVLRWWSGVYNVIFKLLQRDIDIQQIIDDFGTLIYREIDYVAEAANAQRFNELYAGVKDVFVPKIYSELTTRKVLTMEWVDGFRLTDRDTLAKYGLDESKLVDTLVQCSLRQILENGFFHADPHAGNLLAQPDGRLCYLDFGMMSYASIEQRNGFLLAVVHIVNRDWAELVRLYQRLGFIPEGTNLEPIEIALENALPDVLNADISELNIKNIFNELGDIMYTFPFSLPPFYIAIIRCLGVLEGLAIQVDPNSRVVSYSYPYVASRVLTDPQEELQEAFRRLALTSDGHVRWDRLEGLLDEAKGSSGYDVSAALDLLTDYVIKDDSNNILNELSQQIVEAADSLGSDSVKYLLEVSRALAINDEVAAVRAFRSLQAILQQVGSEDGVAGVRKMATHELQDYLPDPTPGMKRFGTILSLLGAQNDETDPAKFVPIIRKLAQEPRIRVAATEIIARIGERVLSRTLRAAFGLPEPVFGRRSEGSTVTEEMLPRA